MFKTDTCPQVNTVLLIQCCPHTVPQRTVTVPHHGVTEMCWMSRLKHWKLHHGLAAQLVNKSSETTVTYVIKNPEEIIGVRVACCRTRFCAARYVGILYASAFRLHRNRAGSLHAELDQSSADSLSTRLICLMREYNNCLTLTAIVQCL